MHMAKIGLVLITLAVLGGAALGVWRWTDHRADDTAWRNLIALSGAPSGRFDLKMIEDLPEPAQQYFRFTIAPGTPLTSAVEIEMTGELGLGNKIDPNYQSMSASQILVPPHGLVWRVTSGMLSGSDGVTPDTSWTRFWLVNLFPVVRAGDDQNRHRAAFGRVVAESAFWSPASLLPSDTVRWTSLDADRARAIITYGVFEQAVDITVAKDGRPEKVVIQRWSNENLEGVYQTQAFGGYLSEFKVFEGYRLPTRVEGGNHMENDDYFPFYKATVTDVRFPVLNGTP